MFRCFLWVLVKELNISYQTAESAADHLHGLEAATEAPKRASRQNREGGKRFPVYEDCNDAPPLTFLPSGSKNGPFLVWLGTSSRENLQRDFRLCPVPCALCPARTLCPSVLLCPLCALLCPPVPALCPLPSALCPLPSILGCRRFG